MKKHWKPRVIWPFIEMTLENDIHLPLDLFANNLNYFISAGQIKNLNGLHMGPGLSQFV